MNALKDVARAHNEELHTVFGNVASQDEQSEISNILKCSTEVLFSKLREEEKKSTCTVGISEECARVYQEDDGDAIDVFDIEVSVVP